MTSILTSTQPVASIKPAVASNNAPSTSASAALIMKDLRAIEEEKGKNQEETKKSTSSNTITYHIE